jgi:hypothetical protein
MAERVLEAHEHAHHPSHEEVLERDAAFRRRVGLLIGILACCLAITSTGGSKMMKRTINANIEASDAYAFFQARNIRQQVLSAASDELDALRKAVPNQPPEALAFIDERQQAYRQQIARFDSSPATGDGKKELLQKAKEASERRAVAANQDEWFELAEAMLQISVVLASTAVLTASRRLLAVTLVLAALGVFGSVNGFFDLIPLPFGD